MSDQAKNKEMKVVGGWEFELEERELAKIADANGRRPYKYWCRPLVARASQ